MSKKKALFIIIAVAVTVAVVAVLLTSYFIKKEESAGSISFAGSDYETYMKYFEQEEIAKQIRSNYIAEVDEDKLVSGSMKGIVDSLDDGFSAFYTRDEYKYFDEGNDGSYIAQGMMLRENEAGNAEVIKVFADTPAYEASIQEGESILSVDGISVRGKDIQTVLAYIRGVDGTEAALTVGNGPSKREIQLSRRSEDLQVVFSSMIDEGTGYIRIYEFSGESEEGFKKALEDLSKENAKRIVIDLRSTPGGNITQVVKIANLLIKNGNICNTQGRNAEGAKWDADGTQKCTLPLAVLVNSDTRGVAEVFAASLQDCGRAYVIGEQTVGKAAVTSTYRITSTGDVVKLRTADYYTASGKPITGVGVTPDENMPDNQTEEEEENNGDALMLRAAEYLKEGK